MVLYIQKNFILNSDNVCYAKIITDKKKGFTNKIQIALVGGESVVIEFSSVKVCKTCFEHIASAIHGSLVHLDFGENEAETQLLYKNIHFVK